MYRAYCTSSVRDFRQMQNNVYDISVASNYYLTEIGSHFAIAKDAEFVVVPQPQCRKKMQRISGLKDIDFISFEMNFSIF